MSIIAGTEMRCKCRCRFIYQQPGWKRCLLATQRHAPSRATVQLLQAINIDAMGWPAMSKDLFLVELIWNELDRRLTSG